MTDNELRERIAALFGYEWHNGNLYAPQESGIGLARIEPPPLNGDTAMALLEMVQRKNLEKPCRYPNEPYAPTVSIRTSSHHAVMAFTSPHFLAEEINARNVCEACVLALEAKSHD